MKTGAMVGALLLVLTGATGQSVVAPDVPAELKVAAEEKVALHARAKGVQIYSCAAGTDGKYSWVLKAPKAELFNEQGKLIGDHFGGPTWRLKDGSEVTGKMVAKRDAPKAGAIPWLLVTVTGHKGSGALESVTTIQRVNTEGGVVDAAKLCDASKSGTESESSYSADYYFYAPGK
jgi:Protein of unknown function (DUF3455)